MNDSPKNFKFSAIEADAEERLPQFTIRKIMLWTAFVGGGLTILSVTLSEADPFLAEMWAVLNLNLYLVVVCGLWSFVQNPRAFEVWFPAGMSVAAAVCFFLFLSQEEGISVLFILFGFFYGIYLLRLNIRQKTKRGFSLTLFVFHVGCWLWWMACAAVMWIAAIGGFA